METREYEYYILFIIVKKKPRRQSDDSRRKFHKYCNLGYRNIIKGYISDRKGNFAKFRKEYYIDMFTWLIS
jgi:hypothetical protein